MADFPRTITPARVTPLRSPMALASWGQSGKGQFRTNVQRGRSWEEMFPPINVEDATGRAFLARIEQIYGSGEVVQAQHLASTRLGAGGGTPLVMGGAQTGSSIIVDGATPNITNWLRAGDLLTITGIGYVLMVTTSCNSNGSGQVTIPIFPSILVAPADNAPVEITTPKFNVVLAAPPNLPDIMQKGWIAGLRLFFREQPT